MTFSIVAADTDRRRLGDRRRVEVPVRRRRRAVGARRGRGRRDAVVGEHVVRPGGTGPDGAGVGAQPALDRLLARRRRPRGPPGGHRRRDRARRDVHRLQVHDVGRGRHRRPASPRRATSLRGRPSWPSWPRVHRDRGRPVRPPAGRARGRRRGGRRQRGRQSAALLVVRDGGGYEGAQRPLHRPARRRPRGSHQRARPDLRRVRRVHARTERSAARGDRGPRRRISSDGWRRSAATPVSPPASTTTSPAPR